MPQLRDSASGVVTERTRREIDGFCRIFGLETEYGVSVTGADHPCDAGQVAMMMFHPLVSMARSTNMYLTNGSRLYLDVGSHPEYATAEAADPWDALALDAAGEQIMRSLASDAEHALQATHGEHARIHLFKNNADSAGHSFGCHENYMVRRFVPLQTVEHELLPFLITRQIFTGAGRVTPSGFEITQRAGFLDEAVSSATTRSRPMVNTRDEPHADPNAFRRLHVIIGDSNRSQWATMMKLATTHLVLCVIEQCHRDGIATGFADFAFADAGVANRAVSADLTCRSADFAMADGSVMHGGALALQYRYLDIVECFVKSHPEVADSLPRTSVTQVLQDWRDVLDTLNSGDAMRLADRIDWVAKRRFFDALEGRRGPIAAARAEQLDMDYHDIVNGKLFESLLQHGMMRVLVDDAQAEYARDHAPDNTRAALRGRFIATARQTGVQFSCDWTRVAITAPYRREAMMIDPFETDPSQDSDFAAVMRMLGESRGSSAI